VGCGEAGSRSVRVDATTICGTDVLSVSDRSDAVDVLAEFPID